MIYYTEKVIHRKNRNTFSIGMKFSCSESCVLSCVANANNVPPYVPMQPIAGFILRCSDNQFVQ